MQKTTRIIKARDARVGTYLIHHAFLWRVVRNEGLFDLTIELAMDEDATHRKVLKVRHDADLVAAR